MKHMPSFMHKRFNLIMGQKGGLFRCGFAVAEIRQLCVDGLYVKLHTIPATGTNRSDAVSMGIMSVITHCHAPAESTTARSGERTTRRSVPVVIPRQQHGHIYLLKLIGITDKKTRQTIPRVHIQVKPANKCFVTLVGYLS